ncbi:nucleoside diphosphate phosphatase ENTPD5 isoform X2 [Pectinophora gossypiella]|uniref:nucleoside diphosphate phosphatase ENTPD5 isoform X2 n=1 Tax=Pectinophora gossypiella TaxID=13191 RepID=UPI00214DF71A|nr:nucleoside diphosphate phosphatase ENTPD5 isoform X2 [Pectinophora gossypiella]
MVHVILISQLKENDSSIPHINLRNRTVKQPRRLKKIFILLIVLALCVTYLLGLFAGQAQLFDGLAKSLGYESVCHYAVIIDAGSSGSRVLAYKFRVPFTLFGSATLDLVDEYFEQSKPGLSSYADDPAKGAQTIVDLIKKAEFITPPEKRAQTPLIVRATAGLRLLPKEKAQQLIDSVSSAISKLGYNVDSNGVQIMDGADEGIFIWYTVNLLNSYLDGRSDTMAALDLGGGSTQITFQLSDDEAPQYNSEDRYVVQQGNNITLYTHSYLNLGLLAARYGIFRLEAGNTTQIKEFTSVCVDPIVQKEAWVYGNIEYTINGAARRALKRKAVYERCHELVKRYVLATLDWEPSQPPRGQVAAMSYFYDVAADYGLIDLVSGGRVSVSEYRQAAVVACSASNVEQPWACIDLVYIVTLLQDAYKMQDHQPVLLFKKINNHEVSWALGLAYTTVMNKIATN